MVFPTLLFLKKSIRVCFALTVPEKCFLCRLDGILSCCAFYSRFSFVLLDSLFALGSCYIDFRVAVLVACQSACHEVEINR